MLTQISKSRSDTSLDLVDLLLECHGRIRRFVSLAYEAAIRSDVPAEETMDVCAQVARYFTEALPLHVADEEESILPRLSACCPGPVTDALTAMAEQHSHHGPKIESLLAALTGVRPALAEASARNELPASEHEPVSQSAPNKSLRSALASAALELEREFAAHLLLEESIIFPAIRAHLPLSVQQQVITELRQRRLPKPCTPST